jgi:uncharacterized RmlC-like cupin family protein
MTESERELFDSGVRTARYYDDLLSQAGDEQFLKEMTSHVIGSEYQPWEISRQGKLKWLFFEKNYPVRIGVDVYIQEIPPGGYSGKHAHSNEEVVYVLEGEGHDMHNDPIADIQERYTWSWEEKPKRFNWAEGDVVYIPPVVAHQHFNDNKSKRCRLLSVSSSLPRLLGFNTLRQLEDARLE